MRTVLKLLGVGWYVAFCILGGAFGGVWIDLKLHSSPIATMLGIILGLFVAGVGIIRMLKLVSGRNDRSN